MTELKAPRNHLASPPLPHEAKPRRGNKIPSVINDREYGVKRKPGRPQGSVSRFDPHLIERVRNKLNEVYNIDDYDPVVQLAVIANNAAYPIELRIIAHSKVAKYWHPELKQIEVVREPEEKIIDNLEPSDRWKRLQELRSVLLPIMEGSDESDSNDG